MNFCVKLLVHKETAAREMTTCRRCYAIPFLMHDTMKCALKFDRAIGQIDPWLSFTKTE